MAENPFKQAIAARKKPSVEPDPPVPPSPVEPKSKKQKEEKPAPAPAPPPEIQRRGRGRPATGKRSDGEWIGRTFYVKRDTDLDVEELLVRLRRQGIEIDKSELVEMLLSALVKWHQGENIEIHLAEISPIQK